MAKRQILGIMKNDTSNKVMTAMNEEIPSFEYNSVESQPKFEFVDAKLFEIMRSNYDLISVIAEINTPSPSANVDEIAPDNSAKKHLLLGAVGDNKAQRRGSLTDELKKFCLKKKSKKLSINDEDFTIQHQKSQILPGTSEKCDIHNTICYSSANSFTDSAECSPITKTKPYQWNHAIGRFGTEILRAVSNDTQSCTLSRHKIVGQKKIADASSSTSTLPKLSPQALKRDVKRCLEESQNYVEIGAGIYDLIIWRNPLATLCLFAIYMYSVWRGWLVPLILSLILIQLGLNWLETQKKINFGLFLFPRSIAGYEKVSVLNSIAADLSGAQLVFDVARRVQNLLTIAADLLEKLRALVLWRRPEVTARFVAIVGTFFMLSLVLSTSSWFILIGLLIGGKIFLMTYLYHRFPRLRPLLDIAHYFYRHLPTLAEAKNQNTMKPHYYGKRNSWAVCRNQALLPSIPSHSSSKRAQSSTIARYRSSIDVAVALATSSNLAGVKKSPSDKMLMGEAASPVAFKETSSQSNNVQFDFCDRRRSICVMSTENLQTSTNDDPCKGLSTCAEKKTDLSQTMLPIFPEFSLISSHQLPQTAPIYSETTGVTQITDMKSNVETNFSDNITNIHINRDVAISNKNILFNNQKICDARINESNKCRNINNDEENTYSQHSANGNEASTTTSCDATSINESDNDLPSFSSSSSSNTKIWKNSFFFNKKAFHQEIADDVIRITRPCFMFTENKSLNRRVKAGLLTLNERMLSFRFDGIKCLNGLARIENIFRKKGKCAQLEPSTFDIPFRNILCLKKVGKEISRKNLNSSTVSSLWISNTRRKGEIELYLTRDCSASTSCYDKQCEQHISNLQKDDYFVVRFTGISERDAFFEAIVETAHIAADINLASI